MFRVNVGEENIYTFTVRDNNDFNVTIAGGTPDGGILSDNGDGMYSFLWRPEVTPIITELSFIWIVQEVQLFTLPLCSCVLVSMEEYAPQKEF